MGGARDKVEVHRLVRIEAWFGMQLASFLNGIGFYPYDEIKNEIISMTEKDIYNKIHRIDEQLLIITINN